MEQFYYSLLNRCLRQCRLPDAWKCATVVVIPKTGDITRINNLRPISLLPIPGKIFERFLNNYLVNYMEDNHIFCNQQMGFRKGHSTTEGCFKLIKDIMDKSNDGDSTVAT